MVFQSLESWPAVERRQLNNRRPGGERRVGEERRTGQGRRIQSPPQERVVVFSGSPYSTPRAKSPRRSVGERRSILDRRNREERRGQPIFR